MLIDAVGYTFGAIRPIRQALSPAELYWQKRLLLNLMLANEGMYFAAAVAIVGAVMKAHQQRGASALLALTLATCLYTCVTVPLLTPARYRACDSACPGGGAHRARLLPGLIQSFFRCWSNRFPSAPVSIHSGKVETAESVLICRLVVSGPGRLSASVQRLT